MRLTASVSALIAGCAAVALGQSPDFTVCPGDLNNDGAVAINEIVTAVDNSLGGCQSSDFPVCPGDQNYDGTVAINEMVTAVDNSLGGCPARVARFADNANGTITDNQTGLTWEKKVWLDGTADLVNPRDAENFYPWAGRFAISGSDCQPTDAASALCAARSENGTTSCNQCGGGEGTCSATTTAWTLAVDANTASFGGHTDWRVPKRGELVSIVDYDGITFYPATYTAFQGASCGEKKKRGSAWVVSTCTDITMRACSCTFPGFYWSTKRAYFPNTVWLVDFYDGGVTPGSKQIDGLVRLVRGGS